MAMTTQGGDNRPEMQDQLALFRTATDRPQDTVAEQDREDQVSATETQHPHEKIDPYTAEEDGAPRDETEERNTLHTDKQEDNALTLRVNKKTLWGSLGVAAVAVAGIAGLSIGRGSGEATPQGETTPLEQPSDTSSEQESELIVNNVCDVLTAQAVANTLGLQEANVIARSCYSDPNRGVITQVEWNTTSGVVLAASVLNDTVVSETSVRNPDGSLLGYGDFEDYYSLQADQYFSVAASNGQEYQGAMNSQSLRVKVEDRVIEVFVGGEPTSPGVRNSIVPANAQRYIDLVHELVEEVFDIDVQ